MTSQLFAGEVYYVDATNGDDNNPGTSQSSPWKTIAKVNSYSFDPGDTIQFKRGEVWRNQLLVTWSGTSGNPITFKDYGTGDKPVIMGSIKKTGWTNESGNLWYTSNSYDPDAIIFVNTDDSMEWGDVKTSKGCLINEYDWWYDSGNTRIYCYAATDPDARYNSVEATRSSPSRCFRLYSQKYIDIENLIFKFARSDGCRTNGTSGSGHAEYINITNCESYYNATHGFKASTDEGGDRVVAQHITYTNCIAHHNGYHGFQASNGSGDVNFIGCTAYNNGTDPKNRNWEGAGFRYGETLNGLMQNCESYGNFYGLRIAGWTYEVEGLTIESCNIHDNTNRGIWILGGGGFTFDSIIIRRNKIHNNANRGLDNAKSLTNGEVYYNLIYENVGGLYWQQCNSGGSSEIYNNVIANNTGTGFTVGSGVNVTVKNNIVYNNSNQINISSGTFDYNHWHPDVSFSQKGPNAITTNPKFISPGNDNYKLQSDSPCIDAGTDVGLTKDYAGNTVPYGNGVDIGAYEYVSDNHLLTSILMPPLLQEKSLLP